MLDDLAKDIKAALYDRARSPFFFTFIASWVGWNFRGIVILFSDIGPDAKFLHWGSIYAGQWELLSRLFLFPLGTCVAFLVVYPWPAQWAFHYWQWRHTKIKAIQQKLEDETPMTQEEAKALRHSMLEQQTQMQSKLSSASALTREAQSQRDEAQTRIVDLTSQLAISQNASNAASVTIRRLEEERDKAKGELAEGLVNLATAHAKLEDEKAKAPPRQVADGKDDRLLRLMGSSVGFDEMQAAVLLKLIDVDGHSVYPSALAEETGQLQIVIDVALDELISRKHLVERVNDGRIRLTDVGKRFALQKNLVIHKKR